MDKAALYRSLAMLSTVALILWGCAVVLSPFIPALLWAVILCMSTWPAYTWLQANMSGRNTLAALSMTFLLALCFLLPLVFLGTSLAENFASIYRTILNELGNEHANAALPQWVVQIPLVGESLNQFWTQHMSDSRKLTEMVQLYAEPVSKELITIGAAVGHGLLDLTLGILIAFFFFRHGELVVQRLSNLVQRFIGARGQRLLDVSKKTMIGVVYGIVGAALAQGALAGIGFWIAGVPGAPLLGFFTLLLSFIPFGPPLLWAPAAFWLFFEDQTGMAIFMALWGLFLVSSIDNVIRPYFISVGSSLPLLLVLLGVFGGIIAFGFIGLFIGPVLLALAYTLVYEWSHGEREEGTDKKEE